MTMVCRFPLVVLAIPLLLTGCTEERQQRQPKIIGYEITVKSDRAIGKTSEILSSHRPEGVSEETRYGRSQDSPIPLATVDSPTAHGRIRMFLNSLRGPDGEMLEYGSAADCCGDLKSLSPEFVVPVTVRIPGRAADVLYFAPGKYGHLLSPSGYTVK